MKAAATHTGAQPCQWVQDDHEDHEELERLLGVELPKGKEEDDDRPPGTPTVHLQAFVLHGSKAQAQSFTYVSADCKHAPGQRLVVSSVAYLSVWSAARWCLSWVALIWINATSRLWKICLHLQLIDKFYHAAHQQIITGMSWAVTFTPAAAHARLCEQKRSPPPPKPSPDRTLHPFPRYLQSECCPKRYSPHTRCIAE